MEQWFVAAKKADFNGLARELHVSPVLVRLMRNRDRKTKEEMEKYLHGSLGDLYEPSLLKDAKLGAEIIKQKILEGKRIRIISDYDVDGVSSNYILYKGLLRCGAEVDYKIPDRIEDGYGINEHLISRAKEDGVDTIITCDNGIAAAEQIAYGNRLGMTFVVTDHHDVPFVEGKDGKRYLLPEAAAVINPKQEDCLYPAKNICGAVVAWKFVQVLYDAFGISRRETECFLEIAALATVCDVMVLQDENRIIVKEGLKRMERTSLPGLKALIRKNQLEEKKISAYHLGFIIGPCINASGRLATAKKALELLLCEEDVRCDEMAGELLELNAERKEMTRQGEEQAYDYLEKTGHAKDKVLLVFLPDCHESIAGIIAGRVRECYNKPVFVLTRTKDGLKGSGRSIETYHMYDEMVKVKDCFTKFGGHPMAAGLSMEENRLEELRKRLNENAQLTEKDFIKKVHIDIPLPVSWISEELMEELDRLEPFGNGNQKPLFAQKDFLITGYRLLGNTGRCLKFFLQDPAGGRMDGIYFGDVAHLLSDMEAVCGKEEKDRLESGYFHHIRMDCTYYPEVNEWRGKRNLQIMIKNYRFKLR
ncbi:MAG: single-stranded-DNA-specific exonuclease RecJ [Eubacteriales bacterium]|nr:single-stranded-DNA-specific exonuclease RecJ [Eubacteriales bacterium]